MKTLKLLTLMIVIITILVSCTNETANTESQTKQQTSGQIVAASDIENIDREPEATEQTSTEQTSIQSVEGEVFNNQKESTQKKSTSTLSQVSAVKTATINEETTTTSTTITQKPVVQNVKNEVVLKPAIKESTIPNKPTKTSGKPSHSVFNSLLSDYVSSSGKVDYAGFKKEEAKLSTYLNHLKDNSVQKDWSRNEKMAFWINLYNASTIKLILENYPIDGIRSINNGKPWDKRWIKVGAETYTLNEIENSILRPQFKDARIHFAVNCAAFSCPRLMNKAFTASNLDELLNENAAWFINNNSFNEISSKKVQISKIFEWYADDFGNIIDYLNKYSDTKIKSNAKVTYKVYDWKLNGK